MPRVPRRCCWQHEYNAVDPVAHTTVPASHRNVATFSLVGSRRRRAAILSDTNADFPTKLLGALCHLPTSSLNSEKITGNHNTTWQINACLLTLRRRTTVCQFCRHELRHRLHPVRSNLSLQHTAPQLLLLSDVVTEQDKKLSYRLQSGRQFGAYISS